MCADLQSPMLQVLSNTSLKVFFSTTPNFCLGMGGGGGYGPPCPPPPQLRRLRYSPSSSSSQKVRNAGFWHSGRLFALLQMPSLQNLKKCLGSPPFKPNIFSFDPPHVFFPWPPVKSHQQTPPPHYLIINERSLRRFFLLIRYCRHETKLQQYLLLLILLIID